MSVSNLRQNWIRILVVGLALAVFGRSAHAAPLYFSSSAGTTWDDSSVNADWSSVSGGPYTSFWSDGSSAQFEGVAGNVNVLGTIASVNSITFAVDGYSFSGGTINLSGAGGNITTGAGTDTIGSTLGGAVGLTKLGTGTLVLTGTNTYSGATTVSSGILSVAGPASLPGYATPGGVVLSANATLMLRTGNGWNDSTIGAMLTNNAAGFVSAGYLGVDTTNGNLASAIAYPASPVGLVKIGPNTLTLTATSSFTGSSTISGGTLQLGSGLSGGNGQLASPTIVNNATLAYDLSGALSYSGVISGSGNVNVLAGGMTFGAVNTYSGTTTVSGGTLILNASSGGSGALPNSAIIVGPGAVLDCNVGDATGYAVSKPLTVYGTLLKANAQSETLFRPITLSGGTMTSTTVGAGAPNGAWNFFGNYIATAPGTSNYISGIGDFSLRTSSCYFNLGANSSLTISVPVTGNGSGTAPLNLAGSGLMTLTGANIYAGATNIGGGTLAFAGGGNSLAGTVTAGTSATSPVTLAFQTGAVASFTGTADGAFNVNYGSTLLIQPGAAITLASDLKLGSLAVGSSGTVIQSGGTVTINNSASGRPLTIGEYPGEASSYTLTGGVLNVPNSVTYLPWDGTSSSSLNISGGSASLQTLSLGRTAGNGNGGVVNLSGSGSLYIGSGGIPMPQSAGSVNLSGGTLGAYAAWVSQAPVSLSNIATINPQTSSITLSGPITGTGSLVQVGSGTLTLSSPSSTYSGGTTIAGGTLQLGSAAGLGATTGNLTVSGGVLNLNGNSPTVGTVTLTSGGIADSSGFASLTGASYIVQSGTVGASLTGIGVTLTKTGTGTVALNGNNSYNGATAVNAGTLLVNGSLDPGTVVSVAASAILTGSGSIPGSTSVATGGIIQAGNNGSGQLSLGSLTFNGSGIINFSSLGNYTAAPGVNVTGFGGLTTTSPINISVATLNGASIGSTYQIIGYNGSVAGAGSAAFHLAPLPSRAVGALSNNGGVIDLTITSTDYLRWTGAASLANGWDTSTQNWILNSTSASTAYIDNPADTVVFDDAAGTANTTVNLNSANVHPNGVTFNNSKDNYVFQGAYGIAGATSLIMNGSGTVTLGTSNSYSGGTVLNNGTVIMGNALALGSGSVAFNGGALLVNGNNLSLANLAGSGLLANGSPTTAATVIVGSDNSNSTYSGGLADGGAASLNLSKTGSGTLTLAGTGTFSGVTTISAGTVQLANPNALFNSTVSLGVTNGLSFPLGTTAAGIGGLSGGGSLALQNLGGTALTLSVGNNNGTTTYSGVLSGSGGLIKTGTGNLWTSGANTFNGGLSINAGTLTINGAGGSGGEYVNSPIVVGSGAVLACNTNDSTGYGVSLPMTIYGTLLKTNTQSETLFRPITLSGGVLTSSTSGTGAPNGAWNFFGNYIATAPSTSNYIGGLGDFSLRTASCYFNLGASSSLTISVPITQNTNSSATPLNLAGSGLLLLTGSNFYTGATNIGGGTLELAGTGSLGNGNVYSPTIANSGVLALNTTVNQTFSGVIAGTGALVQAGPDTLTLSASSSFTGGTTLSGGGLNINNNNALGAGSLMITGGTINSTASGVTLANNPQTWNGNFAFGGANNLNLGTGAVTLSGSSQVTVNTNTLTVGGGISGPYSLTKAGTGNLTLLGNDSIGGATIITAGTFQLGNSASNATVLGNVVDNGVLLFAAAGPQQFAGAVSGSGGVTKSGIGLLTMSGSNTYSGLTNVNAGTLLVNGSLLSTASVNVGSAASLGGFGSVGLATVASGGTIDVSQNPANSPLKPASLTFSGIATLNFGPFGNYISTPAISAGSVVTNGRNTVNLTFPGGIVPNGTYDLLSFGSLTGYGSGAFTLGSNSPTGLGARQSAALVDTGSVLEMVVNGDFPIWTGANGTAWVGQSNWQLYYAGTSTDFQSGDTVQFNDFASTNSGGTSAVLHTTADISNGNVFPTSVTFNNNVLNYTLTGANGIAGTGVLIKNGTAALTITNANTYSGGTQLNAGLLNINNASAIGSGPLVITGGTLDNTSGAAIALSTANPQTWAGNFTFNGSNDLNLGAGTVTLATNAQVTVNQGNLTVAGPIGGTGYSLTAAGGGNLILASANTYNGGTFVLSGTLTAAADGALSSGAAVLDPSAGTATLAFISPTPSVSSISNSGAGTSLVVLGNAALSSSTSLTIGINNASATFGGAISDLSLSNSAASGALVKTGSGTLTLTGSNTYTGGTTLGNGTIVAGNPAALGAGPLTVNGGVLQTTIAGNGGIGSPAVPNNVVINPVAGNTLSSSLGNVILAGNLTGSGTVTATGGNSIYLAGSNSGFSSTYINAAGSTLFNGASAGSPAAAWVISGGSMANVLAGTQTINLGALSGGGILGNEDITGGQAVYSVGALNLSTAYGGTIVDSIGGGGTTALVKTGSGTLTLNSQNPFSGGTTVSSGTLALNYGGTGLGCIVGTATIQPGATLSIQVHDVFGYSNAVQTLTTLNINNGTLYQGYAGNETATDMTINMTGGTIAANASGYYDLFNAGYGGTNFNVISSGTTALISSELRLRETPNPVFTVGSGTTPSGVDLLVSGIIVQASTGLGLTKAGPGLMQLTAVNTYTGTTTINGGTLELGPANGTGNGGSPGYIGSSPIIVGSGATLLTGAEDATGYGSTAPLTIYGTFTKGANVGAGAANHETLNRPTTLAGGTITSADTGDTSGTYPGQVFNDFGATISTAAFSGNSYITLPAGSTFLLRANGGTFPSFNLGTNSALVVGAVLGNYDTNGAGPDPLTINGSGLMMLLAANTYSGVTTLNGGTLQVGNGGSGASINNTASIVDNGSLIFDHSDMVTLTPIITGNGNLVHTGSGLLSLAAANGYGGGTQVSGGTLQLGNASALGTGGLAVNGGVLDLAGYSISVPSVSGAAGVVTNSGFEATVTLTVNQSIPTTFGGTIADGAGTTLLDLTGPGSLELSGTNTYSGGTFVEAGQLILDTPNSLALESGLTVGQRASSLFAPAAGPSIALAEQPAAVPEPGTLVLLAAGAVLLAFRRRRSAAYAPAGSFSRKT
jgi:fibronectin-binding autotransporter adhesin